MTDTLPKNGHHRYTMNGNGHESGRTRHRRMAAPQTIDRIPPHSMEHEMCTLGSCLLDYQTIGVLVRMGLAADDFYRGDHSTIWRTICTLYAAGKPVDLVTTPEALRKSGELEDVGGVKYLAELAECVPSAANAEHYAEVVLERSLLRRQITAADATMKECYEAADGADKIIARSAARTQAIAARVRTNRYRPMSAADLLNKRFEPTRWFVEDLICPGVTVLAGKPKARKSFLAMHLAVAVASGGLALSRYETARGDVLYLALEDSELRLQKRLLLSLGDGPAPAGLYFETKWPTLNDGAVAYIEAWLREPGRRPAMVIVDVLTKLRDPAAPNSNAYQNDYQDMGALKALADDHGIALVLIHHLRKAESADPFDQISGSLGISGASDTPMVLKKLEGRPEWELHMKGRDVTDQVLSLGHQVAGNRWSVLRDPDEPRQDNASPKDLPPTQRRVFDLLAAHANGLTRKRIRELSGATDGDRIPDGTLGCVLKRMNDAGWITKAGDTFLIEPSQRGNCAPETPATAESSETVETAETVRETAAAQPVAPSGAPAKADSAPFDKF